MLRKEGESPTPFTFAEGRDYVNDGQDPAPLLEAAQRLLSEVKPHAVLASLSSGGAGIDEALLAVAHVPTFAMQDIWGDVNLGLGIPASLYLVADEYAVRLTEQRWGVRTIAVGSPKHSLYRSLDVASLRRMGRRSLRVSDGQKVVGFFGQSPAIPGHEAAFEDLIGAMTAVEPQPKLLLREHPKYPDLRRQHTSQARAQGLIVSDVTGDLDAETWLAACDVVTTPFSVCGLDHAYLSAYSPEPIGSVLYLMTNEDLQTFVEDFSGSTRLPIVDQGLGQVAETQADVLPLLLEALGEKYVAGYFTASKDLPKGDPCRVVIARITHALSLGTGLRAAMR